MRLRAVVIKRSVGRLKLFHLRSSYHVDLDERAISAIEGALSGGDRGSGTGLRLVERLERRGLVEDGEFEPIPRRAASDLVWLEVEPVGRCNLACRHCFARFSGVEMPESVFEAVLRGALELGAVEISFNGGEPLLHPACVEWIERASSEGLRTVLFTNGTTVSASVAARLAAARPARVNVSLDGFEEAHDALRGQGAYVLAVAGIRQLVAAGNRVFVTTVVHPGNEASLVEFRRFCKEQLGVLGLRVSTVSPMGRAAGEPSLLMEPGRVRDTYDALPDEHEIRDPPPGLLPCLAGVDKLYVSAGGRVSGCHFFETVGQELGRLPERSLEQVYHSSRDRRSCPTLFDFSLGALGDCLGCPAFGRCRGGCRARAWSITGDRAGPDPVSCHKWGVPVPGRRGESPRG
ncbi:MAG: radical SAM protein [Candidatus Riflebacteria bacterium]|nr:radical SAM protein [Candidatus Riflebacteria bacterium]